MLDSYYPMETIEELVKKNGQVGKLRKGGWPRADVDKVSKIAMSGDYDNVLATCAATLTFE